MIGPDVGRIVETARPTWSVVIPAHNCAGYLPTALAGPLDELAGRDDVEIIVVDDGSDDHPERAVAGIDGAAVVTVLRNESAMGAVPNFNHCLRAASGRFVHLLHGDDGVTAGFYAAAESALNDDPDLVATVCRTRYIDEHGTETVTTRSEREGSGRWENAVETLGVSNRVRPASIVVRRSAYESIGGFREDLPHAADWEMWARLAVHGPIWFIDEVLAAYRAHAESDTAGRVRTGVNVRERREAIEHIAALLPPSSRRSIRRRALLYSTVFAARTAAQVARRRDLRAAVAQLREAAICALAAVRP